MKTLNLKANTPHQVYKSGIGIVAPAATTLEYSADGVTSSTWKDTLEEGNNVINNAPDGLYIKFNKDVVICY